MSTATNPPREEPTMNSDAPDTDPLVLEICELAMFALDADLCGALRDPATRPKALATLRTLVDDVDEAAKFYASQAA